MTGLQSTQKTEKKQQADAAGANKPRSRPASTVPENRAGQRENEKFGFWSCARSASLLLQPVGIVIAFIYVYVLYKEHGVYCLPKQVWAAGAMMAAVVCGACISISATAEFALKRELDLPGLVLGVVALMHVLHALVRVDTVLRAMCSAAVLLQLAVPIIRIRKGFPLVWPVVFLSAFVFAAAWLVSQIIQLIQCPQPFGYAVLSLLDPFSLVTITLWTAVKSDPFDQWLFVMATAAAWQTLTDLVRGLCAVCADVMLVGHLIVLFVIPLMIVCVHKLKNKCAKKNATDGQKDDVALV